MYVDDALPMDSARLSRAAAEHALAQQVSYVIEALHETNRLLRWQLGGALVRRVPPPPAACPPPVLPPLPIAHAPLHDPVVPALGERVVLPPAQKWEDLAPPFADHSFDTHISDTPKDLPDRPTSCSRPPSPQPMREVRELGHLIWTSPCTGTPKPCYAEQHHLSCSPNASVCSSLTRRGKFVKKSRSGRSAPSTSLGTEIVKCHNSSTPHRKCSRHPAGPSDDCSECSRCLAESLASVQWE